MGAESPNTPEAKTRNLSDLESLKGLSLSEAREAVKADAYLSQDRHTLAFLHNDGYVIVDGAEREMDVGAFLFARRSIIMESQAQESFADVKEYDSEAAEAARHSGVEVVNSNERVVYYQEEFDFNAAGK